MRLVQLVTTALGAATLAFGVAQAGPMGGGPASGMGAPAAPVSNPAGVNGMPTQSADTCGDNDATRIPCAHHDAKAKVKSKPKSAASAGANGANASASMSGGAKAAADPATAPASPPQGDSPH